MVPEQFRRPLGLMPQCSYATDSVQRASFGAQGLTVGLVPFSRTYALTASNPRNPTEPDLEGGVIDNHDHSIYGLDGQHV